MATAKASYKQQGQTFPKQGTTEYATIKSQAITLLVQQAEREQKAKDLGIEITDKQIDARLKRSSSSTSAARRSSTRRS